MATININSSTNINAVAYVAGDTLSINAAASASVVRLTIDAQVAADVTKIEGTLPGTIALNSAAELYVVNTSTTTPLIVKLNSEIYDYTMNSRRCLIKTRGNFISIGTGTGAIGYTVSTVVGGKTLDWIPFVEVETSAGSGVYVQYLNIHGNRNNSAGVVPTGFRSFSDCGTTVENGAYFEQNEQTSTIFFATASGGYPPPNGANIRIPNIYFTVVGTPNYTVATRSVFNLSGGSMDIENTMFSNRFYGFFTAAGSLRFVHSNIPQGLNVGSGIRESLYLDYVCTGLDVYVAANAASIGLNWVMPSSTVYIRNFKMINQHSPHTLFAPKNADIDTVYMINFNRQNNFGFNVIVGADGEQSQKTIRNIYNIGTTLNFISLSNCFIENIYLSDRTNSTKIVTFPVYNFIIQTNVSNCIFKTIRVVPGGVPSYNGVIQLANQNCSNIAIRDVVFDADSHANNGIIIDRLVASRIWLYDITITNTRTVNTTLATGNPNGRAITPVRMLVAGGSSSGSLAAAQMMLVKYNSASSITIGGGNVIADVEPLHISKTSTAGVGYMIFFLGSKSTKLPYIYNVLSGTEDTDFSFTGSAVIFITTSASIEWTSNYPAIGVTSMTSAVVPAFVGYTCEFKIKNNRPTEDWPASYTTLNTANLRSAFAALSSYNSNDGFLFKLKITPTIAGTSITQIDISGVTVDETYTATDIGFTEMYMSNLTTGAAIALAETSPSVKIVNYAVATGALQYFEYPHYYNGFTKDYRAISRKVGYRETVVNSSVTLLGATVPMSLVAAWAATNASVAGIAVDGALKTIVVTGTKTFQEVYQQSQYWSCLSTNLLYDIPMTSNDGSTYSVPSDWVLTWDIPTNKTLSGGKLNVSTPGSYSFSLSGTDIIFTAGGSYDLSGATLTGTIELINTSGSPVTVTLLSSVTYVNTGPSITIVIYTPMSEASVTGILTGSRLRVYNETSATEIVNAVQATSSWSLSYNNGSEFTPGDIINIRVTKCGATGYLPFEATAVAGSSGWSALADQELDSVYNTNAIDGSTITTISADYANLQIDANEVDGTLSPQEIYAWFQYNLTTSQGIQDYFGGLVAEDIVSYKVVTSTLNLKIENVSATPLLISGARIYRDDGATLSALLSSGSVHIDSGKVYAIETGTSGLTTAESLTLDKINTIPQDVWANSKALTVTKFEGLK